MSHYTAVEYEGLIQGEGAISPLPASIHNSDFSSSTQLLSYFQSPFQTIPHISTPLYSKLSPHSYTAGLFTMPRRKSPEYYFKSARENRSELSKPRSGVLLNESRGVTLLCTFTLNLYVEVLIYMSSKFIILKQLFNPLAN